MDARRCAPGLRWARSRWWGDLSPSVLRRCSGGAWGRGYCVTAQNRKARIRPVGASLRRDAGSRRSRPVGDEHLEPMACPARDDQRSEPAASGGPPRSVRADEASFRHSRPGQRVRRLNGIRTLGARPVSSEGARHERTDVPGIVAGTRDRIDHSRPPARRDSASRSAPDGCDRFRAPVRPTGLDCAYRPVAPAGALARRSAPLAGGDGAAHGRRRRPDERLPTYSLASRSRHWPTGRTSPRAWSRC